MNFGIEGKRALVCGASRGIGFSCAEMLAAEGANLVLVARGAERLEQAAEELRSKFDVDVDTIAVDLSGTEGRQHVIANCGAVDILIHNGGWPVADRDFREWTHDEWMAAIDAMMMAPIELITGVVDGMIERRFGRIVAITSRFVKEPTLRLSQSVGSRLGLTGFMVGLSKEVAPYNVTVNTTLPGIIETETQVEFGHRLAAAASKTFEEIWHEREQTNSAKRFGTPEEFASLCVYLCSRQAGFITGQNIVCDGGGYPGVL